MPTPGDRHVKIERADGCLQFAVLDRNVGIAGGVIFGAVELGQQLFEVARVSVEAENIVDEVHIIIVKSGISLAVIDIFVKFAHCFIPFKV